MSVFLLSLLLLYVSLVGGWDARTDAPCVAGGGRTCFCKRSGTVQLLLVIIKRIQSIEVEKMSLMTNEIKCYICMISCTFMEQIFMVVYTSMYTQCMYITLITV